MAVRWFYPWSDALGVRLRVATGVYDTVDELRVAMIKHSGPDSGASGADEDTIGVCQASGWDEYGYVDRVLIRLARGHLGTQVVSHEVHHATTALYGAYGGKLPEMADRMPFTHHNEPFAHLFSDILVRLVDRLYDHGYYD